MLAHLHIRAIEPHELPALLDLYRHLHAHDAPLPPDPILRQLWDEILGDPKLHYLVAELDGALVASCTMAIIPNLTRGARPYGVIENVVTHPAHRGRGIGTALMQAAVDLALARNCYKVMLLSNAHRTEAHRFYEKLGFRGDLKTGFVLTPAE